MHLLSYIVSVGQEFRWSLGWKFGLRVHELAVKVLTGD